MIGKTQRWALVLSALAVVVSACAKKPVAAPDFSGQLSLTLPSLSQVGSAVSIIIKAPTASDGLPVTLTAQASYGLQIYFAKFSGGQATVTLPASATQNSGLVTLTALAGSAQSSANLTLLPGPPVEPLTPLVGARSIIADGQHWSMTVVVPFDSFGNPIADGTPLEIQAQHPDGQLETQTIQVAHLLAWARIYSHTQAGPTLITAQANGAHGPESTLLEVPGWPTNLSLSAQPPTLPADGRQLMTLTTGVLRDKFGNILPDGTLVTFIAETAHAEQRIIPTYTLAGVATAPLQAAAEPGVVQVWASVYGVKSDPLQVAFTPGPAVGTFPVKVQVLAADRALQVTAGPVLGPLAQYVPDGTTVLFHITDASAISQWVSTTTSNGFATVEVRLAALTAGQYAIDAMAGSGKGSATFRYP